MEQGRFSGLNKERYVVTGKHCCRCDIKLLPSRKLCLDCKKPVKEVFQLSGDGVIYSYTTVDGPPNRYGKRSPKTIALIKLEEGPLITSQLTDLDNDRVEIGTPVEMVTRILIGVGSEGKKTYGYKFRPRLEKT